jgi:hypothetical protein
VIAAWQTEGRAAQSRGVQKDLVNTRPALAVNSQCVTPDEPDLAAIVAAWPTLPEPVKAGIVAMVKASGT